MGNQQQRDGKSDSLLAESIATEAVSRPTRCFVSVRGSFACLLAIITTT